MGMRRTMGLRDRRGAIVALCVMAGLATGPACALPRLDVVPPARPTDLAPIEMVGATGPTRLAQSGTPSAPTVITPRPINGATAARPALGDKATVERANAALNGITTLVADFSQVNGDGRRLNGILYLQRPGKIRFEYDKPSTLEVVSDGTTVLVRDRKLNTSDPYPIGQTPLKFLLSTRIDLSREASVKSVASDADGARVAIEDSSTLGGTSKITLSFNPDLTQLTRWRVIDAQGYTTTVTLSNQERNTAIDPKIFMLNYMRPVE